MDKGNLKSGDSESFGISGFTLGVMSLVMLILSPLFGILTAIVGGVFSYIQIKRKKNKVAKTGLILNIIGLVLNIALWIVMLVYLVPLLQSGQLAA